MLFVSCLDGENVKLTHFIIKRDRGSCLNALTSHGENRNGEEGKKERVAAENGKCVKERKIHYRKNDKKIEAALRQVCIVDHTVELRDAPTHYGCRITEKGQQQNKC